MHNLDSTNNISSHCCPLKSCLCSLIKEQKRYIKPSVCPKYGGILISITCLVNEFQLLSTKNIEVSER